MPNTNVEDEELRKKIRDEWLIHEEDCQYSMFDIPCDCIQDDVSKNIMQLIAARERKAVEEAEIRAELKVHERYETVPIKNLRSHMEARKNIILAQLTSTKDKS